MIETIDSMGVGRFHRLQQLAADTKPGDGQGLLQPFAQGGGGAGPLAVEAAGQLLQLGGGPLCVAQCPGGAQAALHQGPLRLGQVVGDVIG